MVQVYRIGEEVKSFADFPVFIRHRGSSRPLHRM
jgi:hypothetical protein